MFTEIHKDKLGKFTFQLTELNFAPSTTVEEPPIRLVKKEQTTLEHFRYSSLFFTKEKHALFSQIRRF